MNHFDVIPTQMQPVIISSNSMEKESYILPTYNDNTAA